MAFERNKQTNPEGKQTRDNMHAILRHCCIYNNQPDPKP